MFRSKILDFAWKLSVSTEFHVFFFLFFFFFFLFLVLRNSVGKRNSKLFQEQRNGWIAYRVLDISASSLFLFRLPKFVYSTRKCQGGSYVEFVRCRIFRRNVGEVRALFFIIPAHNLRASAAFVGMQETRNRFSSANGSTARVCPLPFFRAINRETVGSAAENRHDSIAKRRWSPYVAYLCCLLSRGRSMKFRGKGGKHFVIFGEVC